MNMAASFEMRSFAVIAVTALEQYLAALLKVAEVLASQGNAIASAELRRSLERSLRVLGVLQDELTTIEIVENLVRAQQEPPS